MSVLPSPGWSGLIYIYIYLLEYFFVISMLIERFRLQVRVHSQERGFGCCLQSLLWFEINGNSMRIEDLSQDSGDWRFDLNPVPVWALGSRVGSLT